MMIVKLVPSKGSGSFGGLADYILDKANDAAKIKEVAFSNCPYEDTEKNLSYIKSMQQLNQTAKSDKTMHLIVSFQEGEKPSKEVLQNIENEILKSLGLEKHHRLSVTHTNTNNFHMHIAINKIDPETHKLIDPWQSKKKLDKKATELEEKYKLKKDNHTPKWKLEKDGITPETTKSNKSKDIEIHSGMDNLLTWIKEEALDDIKEVLQNPKSTLDDLHKTLAAYNLEIKPRGNGIVIGDKTRNLFIKASDVHRDLSKGKLTKRYGEFRTSKITTKPLKKFGKPKNSYWEKYKALSDLKRITKTEDLKLEKLSRLTLQEALHKKYSEKLRRVQTDPLINKKDKYQARQKIHAAKKTEFTALKDTFATKRKEIYSRTNQMSYKEYLIEEALKGDAGALQQLRKQKQTIKPGDNVLHHPLKKVKHNIFKSMISKITKQGNAVYELGEGKIIDKGNHLKLSIEKSDEAVLTALKMAIAKYGTNLDVQGNIEFKKRILMVSQKHNLKVSFVDPNMKQIQNQHQTKNNQSKQGLKR